MDDLRQYALVEAPALISERIHAGLLHVSPSDDSWNITLQDVVRGALSVFIEAVGSRAFGHRPPNITAPADRSSDRTTPELTNSDNEAPMSGSGSGVSSAGIPGEQHLGLTAIREVEDVTYFTNEQYQAMLAELTELDNLDWDFIDSGTGLPADKDPPPPDWGS